MDDFQGAQRISTSKVLGRQRFGPLGNPVLGDAQGTLGEIWGEVEGKSIFC